MKSVDFPVILLNCSTIQTTAMRTFTLFAPETRQVPSPGGSFCTIGLCSSARLWVLSAENTERSETRTTVMIAATSAISITNSISNGANPHLPRKRPSLLDGLTGQTRAIATHMHPSIRFSWTRSGAPVQRLRASRLPTEPLRNGVGRLDQLAHPAEQRFPRHAVHRAGNADRRDHVARVDAYRRRDGAQSDLALLVVDRIVARAQRRQLAAQRFGIDDGVGRAHRKAARDDALDLLLGLEREEGLSHRRGMHGHARPHLRAHAQRLLALVRDDVE